MRRWLDIQSATFQRWINYHLEERDMFVNDLFKNLRDGTALVNLLEILSKDARIKHYPNPSDLEECEYNNRAIMKFLRHEHGLTFEYKAMDIVKGDPPYVLSLVWMIILKYKLHGRWDSWEELLDWVNDKIGVNTRYNMPTANFTTHWHGGKRICALVDSYVEGMFPDIVNSSDDPLDLAEDGVDAAMTELDVPPVLTPDDMTHPHLDELSTITYLSMFREMAELKMAEHVPDDGTVPLTGVLVDHDSDSSDGEDVDESIGHDDTLHHSYLAKVIIGAPPDPVHQPRMASPPPAPLADESDEESSDEEYELANDVMPNTRESSEAGGSSYALADEVLPEPVREPTPEPVREPTPAEVMAVQPTLVSARMQAGLEIQVHHGPASTVTLDGVSGVRRGLGYMPTDLEAVDADNEEERVYQVHVFWQGQPIEGSPFAVDSLQ
eukprot:m.198310 g.198310  ORF g.198310 m.198310 type:complete len:439 (+) comp17040_c0_seq2:1411-2727(+)